MLRGHGHQIWGTLDVVIVPVDITKVSVVDPSGVISDRGLVVADLPIRPARQMLSSIVCSWKALNRTAFGEEIVESSLNKTPIAWQHFDQLFSECERSLLRWPTAFCSESYRTVTEHVSEAVEDYMFE